MLKIFDNISAPNKAKLLRLLETHQFTFQNETSIMSSIESDNIIGIISTGYAEIIRTDHNGNKSVIEQLEEEDIFGTEISSLKNPEYDIIAKENNTQVIIINYNNIINCKENNKDLLQLFTIKIKEKNERLNIITKKTIRDKILEYFSIEFKKHGSNYIYLPSTFTALADFLAIDRSAMTRELKNLKDEGLIAIKGKRITLLYNNNWF